MPPRLVNGTAIINIIENHGQLYITGGKFEGIEGYERCDCLNNRGGGIAYISGGEFKSRGNLSAPLLNQEGGILNISGGKFEAVENSEARFVLWNRAGSTVNISGGKFYAEGWKNWHNKYCLYNYGDGNNTDGGTMNISGGHFRADSIPEGFVKFEKEYALYNGKGGTANVSGGIFESRCGMYGDGSKINILSGNTINGVEPKINVNYVSTVTINNQKYDTVDFNNYVINRTSFIMPNPIEDSEFEVSPYIKIASMDGNVVNLYGDSFDANGASLLANSGDYVFNLSQNSQTKFYGSDSADTIIAGSNMAIDGGKGDDFIAAGKGDLILYNSGDGNDIIELSDSGSLLIIAGDTYTTSLDGNDVIVTVGDGKITVLNAKEYDLDIIGTSGEDTTPEDTTPEDTVPQNVFVIEGDTNASIDMANSEYDSIVAYSGKATLDNYSSDSEAGIVTPNVSDIAKGIKDKSIVLSGDEIEVNSLATVKVNGSEDFTTANLITSGGKRQRVAFAGKNGGDLDISGKSDKFILQGNYGEENTAGTNIVGNSANDIIFAGSKDTVNGGGGKNQIYLTNESNRGSEEGATIVLGESSKNTVSGFGSNDVVQVEDLDDFTYSFNNKNLVVKSGEGKLKFDGVMTDGILLTDGEETISGIFAHSGERISVDENNLPTRFLGKKSCLDFSDVNEETYVNLAEGSGTVNGKTFGMSGINKVEVGDGDSTVIGSDSKDTLTAGNGNTNLDGGEGNDVLIGRNDKTGRTTFQFEAGDGHDVIKNFEFTTGDNSKTADSISVDGDINSAYQSGEDVIVKLDGGAEIKVKDAADQNISINGLTAKVGRKLSYDGVADNYIGSGTSSLSVDSSVGSAEIWLDNSQDTKFYGDIRMLDASEVKGSTKLVGNDSDNKIIAGQGDASLWGGASASNDELIGGEGQNTFFYCNGNGNDTIKSNGVNDTVILADVMAENLASGNITANSVIINLTDGGSLTVNGTTDVTYQLADGSRYTANRSTGEWQTK